MSFRLKTILGVALIEAVLLAVLVSTSYLRLRASTEEEMIKRAHTTALLFASTTTGAMLATDIATLDGFVQEVLKYSGVAYARVRDHDGRVLAEGGDAPALARSFKPDLRIGTVDDGVFDTFADIAVASETYGRVEVGVPISALERVLTVALKDTTAIALMEMGLVALLSFMLGAYLTRQLKGLREGAQRMADGQLGYQVPVRGRDELAETAIAFNRMSSTVRKLFGDLRKALEEITRSHSELARIGYVSSHELLQPVVGLEGFANLLRERLGEAGDPEIRECVDAIDENTRRTRSMVDGLRAYMGIDADGRPFAPVDTVRVVEAVLSDLGQAVAASGAEVDVARLPSLWANETQLFSLFRNLLANAIKFRHPDRRPKVRISAEQTGETWTFTVEDNGLGIAPKDHERVFQIFQRLHPWQQYPGSGVGLALCRAIVEHHGGRIGVEAEAGQGSLFRFSLPAFHDIRAGV